MLAGPAAAGIVVGPPPGPGGAAGLLVPGHGAFVTRAEALRALDGQTGPPGATVYVTLPPPGETHNVRRYPVTVVGPGFDGLLTSSATRIPGLVSIADLDGLRARADANPGATLRRLDHRLARAHDARNWATVTVMLCALALCAAALLVRSRLLARAAALSIPASLSAALLLSALGGFQPTVALVALAALTLGVALALSPLPLEPLLLLFLAGYLVVLTVWPEANSLAIVGPHPDGGGRFYGVTNEVETLLLVPVVLAARRFFVPAAALSLALVGWSRAGADGGGLVVFAVALLLLRLQRLSLKLLLGAVALAVGLVGIDAALGGSSHVTHTIFHPVRLAHAFTHRWHTSWDGVTATGHAALIAGLTLAALAMFSLLRPRSRELDAVLVALAVSLLVNDTASDVIGFGALSCAVVWTLVRLAPRCAAPPSSPSFSPLWPPSRPVAAARVWSRRPPRP